MMKTNFVQFAFGSYTLHNRAILSVLSLASFYTFKEGEHIIIFTDSPNYYRSFLKDLPIHYVEIQNEDVKQMMGDDDLIHRVKIGIIEKATQLYPQHQILYTDSDTFFIQPVNLLLQNLSNSTSLMHCFEFKMNDVEDRSEEDITRCFSEMINQSNYIFKDKIVTVEARAFSSWNAGLIGLHPEHFHLLPFVYQLTDQWYAKMRHHGAEQFAFSYILEHYTQLLLGESYCYHYWPSVKKRITDELLKKELNENFKNKNLEQKLKWAVTLSKQLPQIYNTHYYTLQSNMALAFEERKYKKGYLKSFQNLFKKPQHSIEILKDTAYYTKKILFGI
ncbi:MAG: hypothetical protein HC912_07545 [Saprospiraceae bacterium]|nr:hypothetical protein [Saprospiraceae bacterium]